MLESLIKTISPTWAVKRAQMRRVLAAYEAGNKNNRLRKDRPDNSSGDYLTKKAGANIRGYARIQEQNYDLAEGILATLVDNVIGPHGISLEPQPKNKDGSINKEFANEIDKLRKLWCKKPEVTHEHSWSACERLAARAWFRDGEFLLQHLQGRISGLQHGSTVPYSVELIESDLLPFELNDESKNITQGVERNQWGKVSAYHILPDHPGDTSFSHLFKTTRRVEADKILHPKIVRRFKQARGVSLFAPMLRRLEDIKDYEENERVASRIASSFCAYIKKPFPDDYEAPDDEDDDRSFKMHPGMIFDRLKEGEEVGTIDSNRPSSLLEGFRDSMVRMLSAASRTTYSSINRKYDGSYSSQRQELVEGYISYAALSMLFASQVTIPVYEKFLELAILSGLLRVPAEIDRLTLFDCDIRPPAMPWIDPDKETKANERMEKAGHKAAQEIIRSRGGNPDAVLESIAIWRQAAKEKGLVFSTDAANEMAQAPPTQSTNTDE